MITSSVTIKSSQRGATLITALVMLVVLTILVISAIRSSTVNLRIAGNAQIGEEAAAAAQQAVEWTISTNFTLNPFGAAQTTPINTYYQVTVPVPACTGSTALPQASLDPTNPNDAACFTHSPISDGEFSALNPLPSGNSDCLSQQWDVQAHAADATGASATVHQGVGLRVAKGTSC